MRKASSETTALTSEAISTAQARSLSLSQLLHPSQPQSSVHRPRQLSQPSRAVSSPGIPRQPWRINAPGAHAPQEGCFLLAASQRNTLASRHPAPGASAVPALYGRLGDLQRRTVCGRAGAGHSSLCSTLLGVRACYFWFNIVFFTGANICVFVIIKQKCVTKITAHTFLPFM